MVGRSILIVACVLVACAAAVQGTAPTLPTSFRSWWSDADGSRTTVFWDASNGRIFYESASTAGPAKPGTSSWFTYDSPTMTYKGDVHGTGTCCFQYLHNPFPPSAWMPLYGPGGESPVAHTTCGGVAVDCWNGTAYFTGPGRPALMCWERSSVVDVDADAPVIPICTKHVDKEAQLMSMLDVMEPRAPPASSFVLAPACDTQC